jgi:hypothetical protein
MDITVRYYGPEDLAGLQAYRLRVVVAAATDISTKIFVFRTKVDSNTDQGFNSTNDSFVSVADPVDLEQYPEDAPDLDNNMPYYRLDEVTLDFRSVGELEDVKALIETDINSLVASMKSLETLTLMEEVIHA